MHQASSLPQAAQALSVTLLYERILLALQVLLPLHPGLGRLLMSRHLAIQVLERQTDFLQTIEEAGES